MDVMYRQSKRLICQTAHGSLSTNSVRDVGLRTRHNDPLRTECESQEKRLESQSPQPNEVEQSTVFTQSSPEDRDVDKEQGHQPKDWSCNKVRPQSHTSSGSRTAGQVSPRDVGYLRGSGVLWKIARDVQVQTVQTTDRRQKCQASHSRRRGNPEPFHKNNSATHKRTGRQKDCLSGSMVASAGSRLQASQKFLAKSVHLQTITEAFFRAFK